jgi:hypothetical protein
MSRYRWRWHQREKIPNRVEVEERPRDSKAKKGSSPHFTRWREAPKLEYIVLNSRVVPLDLPTTDKLIVSCGFNLSYDVLSANAGGFQSRRVFRPRGTKLPNKLLFPEHVNSTIDRRDRLFNQTLLKR